MRPGKIAAAVLGLAALTARADDGRNGFDAAVDLAVLHADSPLPSWLNGGDGKLRFDQARDGLHFERAFLDYRGRVLDTLTARATVNIQDGVSHIIDLTEAYLEWRPVPVTGWKIRTRAGAFYPRMSVENTAAGWSSPYMLSSSAINTWIGEELRTIGVETRVSHDLPFLPPGNSIAIEGAVFFANDPTGALLQGRGWAIHDRQTGIFSSIPLPPVSAIEPWDFQPPARDNVAPFREVDGHSGYYIGVEWQLADFLRMKAMHYDNHANPVAQAGGQYAWQMWFDHVGVAAELPGGVGLLGQWLAGASRAGQDFGPWRVYDADFKAWFLLLTKSLDRHRVSLRFDRFDTTPNNDPDNYVNQDTGHAWAASYLYQWTRHLRVGAEYLAMRTRHCVATDCAWALAGLPAVTREESLQVQVRLQFGN